MNHSVRVAVAMGGFSSERDISLQSGRGVLAALERLGYGAVALDFDERFVERLREINPAVVFNALHGVGGEDGVIQGVLEWMRIPYTGSGVRACAVSMDKHLTKKLLAAEGLPTAPWEIFSPGAGASALLPGTLNLPLVVKPRAEGSSTGVCIVRTHEELAHAMRESAAYAGDVLVEEYIRGREFSCGVLFEQTLPVVEIVPLQSGFYSYDAKYVVGGSRHETPARIDAELTRRLQALALSVHRCVGLRDYSRTDIIVREDGRPYILEINALPGLTPTSLLPEECAALGISYDELIERLVKAALERGQSVCV